MLREYEDTSTLIVMQKGNFPAEWSVWAEEGLEESEMAKCDHQDTGEYV